MSTLKNDVAHIIISTVKNIKGFRKDKELAEWLGIAPNVLTNWKARGIADISVFTAKGFSEEWVRTGEGKIKKHITGSIATPVDLEDTNQKVMLLPVYATVPAGWPIDPYVSEEPIDYVPILGNGRNMGALQVEGHSMSPEIRDGEFVVYVEDYNIRPGDRVVVTNEFNKPMVKEYAMKEGEPWLISVNPEYENHKVNEHYKIIGRVVEIYNKRKIGRR